MTDTPNPLATIGDPAPRRPDGQRLTESDAIDIWIARWMRVRRKDLCRRYNCDPRRLYEIWSEARFAGSRTKALAILEERHPGLGARIDAGLHRTIPRAAPPSQLDLFGKPDVSQGQSPSPRTI